MSTDDATYRILDASWNRAAEGLRCLEEYARFVLDDASASGELKSLRHDLAATLARFPRSKLLAARDTVSDVGTTIEGAAEYDRQSLGSVVAAAASRTAQSLRVLEEYGKTIDATTAREIERLRYRCYTIGADLESRSTQNERQQRLSSASLYVLIDAGDSSQQFAARVRLLYEQGVDLLQLRDREVDDRTLVERSRVGSEIAREWGGLFIVNDRADIALAAAADGVHVGQDELPAKFARQIVGSDRLIGISTHSLDQAQQAVADGADYIGCGPVFPGRTKAFDEYVGTAFLEEVSREIKLPAFAIGGINQSNVAQVCAAGVKRIAVTGAVRDADDVGAAVQTLKRSLA